MDGNHSPSSNAHIQKDAGPTDAYHTPLARPNDVSTTTPETRELLARISECETQLAELRSRLSESQQASRLAQSESSDIGNDDPFSALEMDEYKRYGRQLIMEEIGLLGQTRLKTSSALIVGAGGLGCPAAAYLAGSGIGTIGLVDGDTVEESNLHRQILHSTSKVGWLKVDSAVAYLRGLNPNVRYRAHGGKTLSPSNATEIVSQYDIVLDCTDNPASRYLISDVCVQQGKPLISASALKTEGQLMVLNFPVRPPGYIPDPSLDPVVPVPAIKKTKFSAPTPRNPDAGGPCYRCVFPRPPPPDMVVSCGDGGVLGPVVGTMGVLQALEAIKVVTSDLFWQQRSPQQEASSSDPKAIRSNNSTTSTASSSSLYFSPTLLIFSAYSSPQFRAVRLRGRRDDCVVCSAHATITPETIFSDTQNYLQVCGAGQVPTQASGSQGTESPFTRISASDARDRFFSSNQKNLNGDGENSENGGNTDEKPEISTIMIDVRDNVQWSISALKGCPNLPYNDFARVREEEWELLRQKLMKGVPAPSPDVYFDSVEKDKIPEVLTRLHDKIMGGGSLWGFGSSPSPSPSQPTSQSQSQSQSRPELVSRTINITSICRRGIDSQLVADLLTKQLGDLVIPLGVAKVGAEGKSGTAAETEAIPGSGPGLGGRAELRIKASDVVGGFGSWRREVDDRFPEY